MKINRKQLRRLIESTVKNVGAAALSNPNLLVPANMVKTSISPVIQKALQRAAQEADPKSNPEEFFKKYVEIVQEFQGKTKENQEPEDGKKKNQNQEAEDGKKKNQNQVSKKDAQTRKAKSYAKDWDNYAKKSNLHKKLRNKWNEATGESMKSFKSFIKWYNKFRKTGDTGVGTNFDTISGKSMGNKTHFTPKEIIDVLDKIQADGKKISKLTGNLNENLSRGALIRRRYYGRY